MKKILIVLFFIVVSISLVSIPKITYAQTELVPCHAGDSFYWQGATCRRSYACAPSSTADGQANGYCLCATAGESDLGKCQADAGAAFGNLKPPDYIQNWGFGDLGLGNIIAKLINLFYVLASLVLLFMLLLAGFNWTTSQGDKEKVSKARATIINAIIGIVIIALAFVVTNTIILPTLGFNKISTQGQPPPGPVIPPVVPCPPTGC